MQSAPWLGLVPGNDGQVKHAYTDNTPFTRLLSGATNAVTSSPACPNPSTFLVMSKQAEAASKSIDNFTGLCFLVTCMLTEIFRGAKS